MAGVGGYMRPAQPAAVSGPGKLSQRTDGGPGETPKQAARYISGMPWGEGAEVNALAQAAPLAAAAPPIRVVPLNAPTERPDEHVTTAHDVVPMPPPQEQDMVAAAIRAAYAAYPSPQLAALLNNLEAQGR